MGTPAPTPLMIPPYLFNLHQDITDQLNPCLFQVIRCMNKDSHVILCGQISVYNEDHPYPPPIPEDIQCTLKDRNITRDRYQLISYMEKFPDGKKQLETWVREGKLKNRETVVAGLENTGRAFVDMMSGGNIGKQVVKAAEVTRWTWKATDYKHNHSKILA